MEPENINDMGLVIACDELSVRQWHPELDGGGKPEQVHIVMKPILSLSVNVTLVMRLKSRQAAEDLAAAVLEHAREVWPDT